MRAGETTGLYSGRAGGVKNFFGVGALPGKVGTVVAFAGEPDWRSRALPEKEENS